MAAILSWPQCVNLIVHIPIVPILIQIEIVSCGRKMPLPGDTKGNEYSHEDISLCLDFLIK